MQGKMLFLCVLLFALNTGCGKNADDAAVLNESKAPENRIHLLLMTKDDENELFRIGDSVCMPGEARLYLYSMQSAYQSVYGSSIWSKTADEHNLEEEFKESALSRICAVKTLCLMAADRGVELSAEEKKLADEGAVSFISSAGPDGAARTGLDNEGIKKCFEELVLADKVYRDILEETEPEISDDEARMVTVSQILLKTYSLGSGGRTEYSDEDKRRVYQKALGILTQINQGGDFDTIAAISNEADKVTVSFGRDEREKAVSDAAFMLSQGEVSRVIETSDGYLILKCVQSFDREQTDLRKGEIAKKKKEESFARIYDEFSGQLLRSFNEDEWEKIHFSKDELGSGENIFDIVSTLFE